jgi:hypothetical protein
VCPNCSGDKGTVSIAWVVAVDLPHSEQCPHPQEVLAEKCGLNGVCELVDPDDGGHGSTSSSSIVDVLHSALSLSKSIMI